MANRRGRRARIVERAAPPPARAPGGPPTAPDARFTLFAVTFAISAIFETSAQGIAPRMEATPLLYGATTLAALFVLARPTDVVRLVALAAVFAAGIVVTLPRIPNHEVFELFAALTILAAALVLTLRARGARPSPAALFAAFAPPLRLSLAVLYLWAVVHKLNADFFEFDVSCGVVHLREVRRYLWFLVPGTDAMRYFAVYGTVAVETAIALLIFPRRTRYATIGLALGFHWVLGAGYARFSAMLVAMLTLFIDAPLIESAAPWRWLRSKLGHRVHASLVGAAAVAFGTVAATHVGAKSPPISIHMVTVAWLTYGLFAALGFGVALARATRLVAPPGRLLAFPIPALALVPLLVFLNGAAPHVGFRNTLAFAMYSNLRTEGGRTNHLFLPTSLQVFDHLRDLVTIVSSSDPVLSGLSRRQWAGSSYFYSYIVGFRDLPADQAPAWRLPFLGLRDRITTLAEQRARDVRVVYERAGTVHTLDRAEREFELARATLLERKVLFMRAVPDSARVPCMW